MPAPRSLCTVGGGGEKSPVSQHSPGCPRLKPQKYLIKRWCGCLPGSRVPGALGRPGGGGGEVQLFLNPLGSTKTDRHLSDISPCRVHLTTPGPPASAAQPHAPIFYWLPAGSTGLEGKGACLAGRARVRAVSSTLPPAVFLEMGLGLAQRRLLPPQI